MDNIFEPVKYLKLNVMQIPPGSMALYEEIRFRASQEGWSKEDTDALLSHIASQEHYWQRVDAAKAHSSLYQEKS